MSEYQYYEFHTIDRPLTADEQAKMRRLSSRVVLSPTRAAFNYSYGDFRGSPLQVLTEHFDALLYMANWGSRQLAFRFPKSLVSAAQFEAYMLPADEGLIMEVEDTPQHIILNLEIEDEEGDDWIEGEGWLDPLIPLRNALLRGDMRALYVFWLKAAVWRVESGGDDHYGYVDYDDDEAQDAGALIEPPVPPGLGELDAPLQAFAEFFQIDQDLIVAAAEASPNLTAISEPLEDWIALLPPNERDTFLLRVARGDTYAGIELLGRLREVGGTKAGRPLGDTARRTFAEIKQAAQGQEQRRVQREKEAAERARLKALADLAQREKLVWGEIPPLLAQRTASGYDQAVAHLAALRDLAVHRVQLEAFEKRMHEILAPYASSAALKRRLTDKGLY